MRYEVQEVVDYSKVGFGSLIIMDDTLWTVLLSSHGEKECLLVSLRGNKVVEEFDDLVDLVVYLKLYESEIKKILPEDDFIIRITET